MRSEEEGFTTSASLRAEYVSRINVAMDYVEAHLDCELTLAEIARVAGFSPFHFHRIFKAMVGETLNDFIQRLRLERAASQLVTQPHKPITRSPSTAASPDPPPSPAPSGRPSALARASGGPDTPATGRRARTAKRVARQAKTPPPSVGILKLRPGTAPPGGLRNTSRGGTR